MKHLFLIRHAKSSREDDAPLDRDRPLSEHGRRQVAAMAEPLKTLGALDGPLHASAARRTRETLAGLAAALPDGGLSARSHYHDSLYTFDGKALRRWLQALPDEIERLTLIGHNPALLELAARLTDNAPKRLPTAGALHVTLPVRSWRAIGKSAGKVVARLTPDEVSHALFKRRMAPPDGLSRLPFEKRIPLLLEHRYRLIRALEPGVMAGHDPEFLHQYRVNLRRSRAIVESLLAVADAPELNKPLKRLKRRGRDAGALRDLDVAIASLPREAPREARAAQAPVVAWLHRRARKAHRELYRQLRSAAYHEEMAQWQRLIASRSFERLLAEVDAGSIAGVLARSIALYDARQAALTADSPDEALHDQRKAVKRIRYLAELDEERHRPFLARLREYQERFGQFQDLSTQLDIFTALAASPEARQLPDEASAGLAAWMADLNQRKAALRKEILRLPALGVPEQGDTSAERQASAPPVPRS